jgi:DUF4097 and DUF4098 domain-containing protein YvlB
MKKLLHEMKKIITVVCFMTVVTGYAQTFSDKVNQELTFEKTGPGNALIVANINGSIKISGYDGDKIMVEVNRTIKAKTNERLENAKGQIKPGVIDRADTLILYTEGVCSGFGRTSGTKSDWLHRQGWGYKWNNCDGDCKELADYSLDYAIKVPRRLNILVSTVNGGTVEIENVNGAIMAHHVNGSIVLSNISSEAWASTINGDVDITYARNPARPCRFYSLNGDITAWFPKGLSAEMTFESFNGELFTNLPQLESMPVMVEKKETERGIKYKVNGNRFKIGAGGTRLDFETFNGNVYVKEKS